MLARRIRRDVEERGRSVDGILEQYVAEWQSFYWVHLMSRQVSAMREASL